MNRNGAGPAEDRARRGRRVALALIVAATGWAGARYVSQHAFLLVAVIAALTIGELALSRARAKARVVPAVHVAIFAALCAWSLFALRKGDLGWSLAVICLAAGVLAVSLLGQGSRRSAGVLVAVAAMMGLTGLVELALPPGLALLSRSAATDYPRQELPQPLYDRDADLGWILKENTEVEHVGFLAPGTEEWRVKYRTDAARQRLVPGRPDAGPAILMLGCSYTFGHALEDHETIASRIQARLPERRVYNYGVNAYGSAQALLRFQQARETNIEWVWHFLIDPHFARNAGDFEWIQRHGIQPLFAVDEARGFPQLVPRSRWPWRADLAAEPHMLHRFLDGRSFFYERAMIAADMSDAAKIRLTAAIMMNFQEEAVRRRVRRERFVVAFLPTRTDRLSARQETLLADLRSRGVECLDLAAPLRAHLERHPAVELKHVFDRTSGHPTAALADLIAGWCTEHMQGAPAE